MTLFDTSKLAALRGSTLVVDGYRNQAPGFDPRSGEGARRFGGRFNPPNSFAVIYLCTSRPCVVAELTRQARRQSLAVDDLLPRELWQLTARLAKVLDLTRRNTLKSLDLVAADLIRDDVKLTRAIGDAAHAQGFHAIRSSSATGVDAIVAIMLDNLTGVEVNAELIETWRTATELE